MRLHTIARMSAVVALLSVGFAAKAQHRRCEETGCERRRERCNISCAEFMLKPHYEGPRIFKNTRYDNSYKHRNFSHQHSAYKSNWERRPYVDPRKS